MKDMISSKESWESIAQPSELAFHQNNKWREDKNFVIESKKLFEYFGFDGYDFLGKNVMDLGAGSKLRTTFFVGANIYVVEPLADEFKKIAHCDYSSAKSVFSMPAEELVGDLIGNMDIVTSINVLDHCYNFPKIISNISKYLIEGGLALMSYD